MTSTIIEKSATITIIENQLQLSTKGNKKAADQIQTALILTSRIITLPKGKPDAKIIEQGWMENKSK